MEQLLQQLIEQAVTENQLLEQQNRLLKKQQASLDTIHGDLADLHQAQLLANELLGNELVHLLSEPLMDKNEVMAYLKISDSTYRRYVSDGKLNPMWLDKIDWYYKRDLAKALEESRRKGRI